MAGERLQFEPLHPKSTFCDPSGRVVQAGEPVDLDDEGFIATIRSSYAGRAGASCLVPFANGSKAPEDTERADLLHAAESADRAAGRLLDEKADALRRATAAERRAADAELEASRLISEVQKLEREAVDLRLAAQQAQQPKKRGRKAPR